MKSAIILLCLFSTAFCAPQSAKEVGSIGDILDNAVETTKNIVQKTETAVLNKPIDVDFSKKFGELLKSGEELFSDAKAYVKQNELPVELEKVFNKAIDAIDNILKVGRKLEPTNKSGIIKVEQQIIETAKEIRNIANAALEKEGVDDETARKLKKIVKGAQKLADLHTTFKSLVSNY